MQNKRKKYRLLHRLEVNLEIPMFLLALVWLFLFFVETFGTLSPIQEWIIYVIWIGFVLEFLLKFTLAPRKRSYLRRNWVTLLALLIPALRIFRLLGALRILQSVKVVNTTKVVRALTSGKRFFSALKEAQGPEPHPVMDVGILIAYGKQENKELLQQYTQNLINDVTGPLEDSTGITWNLVIIESRKLDSDKARKPSDFIENASMAMTEGPYDLVNVITDVALISRKEHLTAGLCSSVSRIFVMAPRKFLNMKTQGEDALLNSEIRQKSAWLFLHLCGHLFGLKHKVKSSVMNPIGKGRGIPQFSADEKDHLREKAKELPDRELMGGNWVEIFIFHILMALRHPRQLLTPLIVNKSLLLPLSLPGLATAAVAPTLLLVFTAEIWDVGLNMSNGTATFFAIFSVMLASFYLVRVQSLFLPRKEKSVITEHLAVANTVIYCSIFLACVGLFLMVGILMMIIELYVFPPDLIQTWPTLDQPQVGFWDKVRLAAFISTVGVVTGALAGGFENRSVLQHLALFRGTT